VKAGTEVAHGPLDRRLEVERITCRRLEHPMRNKAHLVRPAVPRHGDDGGAVAFDRGIDADPHRHRPVNNQRPRIGIDAGVEPGHFHEARLGRDPAVLDHPQILIPTQAAAHLGKPNLGLPDSSLGRIQF